jgi:dipeptidyl aminopeptidase/acylaminoacyl peptidase
MHKPALAIILAALTATAAFALVPAASTATATSNIAYTDSSGSLYVAATTGTGAKTLYTSDGSTTLQALAIAPGGKSVLVITTDTRELALVPVAGGKPAVITGTADATSGDFAPDGKTVVFSTADGIYTVAATGGTATRLLSTPDGATDSLVVYSPNGKQIAFERDAYDANDDETVTLELFTIGAAGVKDLATGVLPDLGSGGRISFSPNGKTLVFAGNYNDPGLFTVPVAGGNTAHLTTDNDLWPSYSTDGTKIFFSRDAYSAGADGPPSGTNLDELWSVPANGNGAAVIKQGDYETLVVGSTAATPTGTTTGTTGTTTTSTTTTTSNSTAVTPGALSVKLTVTGKLYKVSWTGTAKNWKVTLKVGKKTSTATVKGAVHTRTFTVAAKGAISVTVAALG